MKVINVVGKVDTRPIIYPLARALVLRGQVGVVTDDGAYRRLFHGRDNIGTVSGVDIGVTGHVDATTVGILNSTGINYDYLIIVGTDYLNTSSDGILVCHGVDRSMMNALSAEDQDDDLIFIEGLKSASDAAKAAENVLNDPKKSSKKKGTSLEEPSSTVMETPEAKAEAEAKALENAKARDQIIVPKGVEYVECQVGYAPIPKSGIIGLSLKEGHIQYVYNCEENKQLMINPDKTLNTLLCKVSEKLLGITSSEMATLLAKDESTADPKSGKKK